jgi:hypothetical protein
VAATEEVNETIPGNGLGAKRGSSVERVALDVEQVLQTSQGVAIILFGGKEWRRHGSRVAWRVDSPDENVLAKRHLGG